MTEPVASPQRRGRVEGGRSNVVKVRLSDEELRDVTARAEAVLMTVPGFLAESVRVDPPSGVGAMSLSDRRAFAAELSGVVRLLRYAGNNVNQLAAVANSTGVVPPETAAVLELLTRTVRRVSEVAGRLDPTGRS